MSIAMEKVKTTKTKTIMAYKLAKYKWQGGNFKHDISTYLIFVIFLHRQNFWRLKFTPKNAQKARKIHSKLPIFRKLHSKLPLFCI